VTASPRASGNAASPTAAPFTTAGIAVCRPSDPASSPSVNAWRRVVVPATVTSTVGAGSERAAS